jgi:hypothetical protein
VQHRVTGRQCALKVVELAHLSRQQVQALCQEYEVMKNLGTAMEILQTAQRHPLADLGFLSEY